MAPKSLYYFLKDNNGRIVVDFNGKAIMLKHSDFVTVKAEGSEPDRRSNAAGLGDFSAVKDSGVDIFSRHTPPPFLLHKAPQGTGGKTVANN